MKTLDYAIHVPPRPERSIPELLEALNDIDDAIDSIIRQREERIGDAPSTLDLWTGRSEREVDVDDLDEKLNELRRERDRLEAVLEIAEAWESAESDDERISGSA